jgi:hypothetical protein
MPYDPTKPADDSLADAAELRTQFAGLKELIDAKVNTADLLPTINANSSGPIAGQVDYLNISPNDPPTMADLQAVIDKVNELITALRRT